MNSQVWWFVARSSGIVAWALLSASVLWGLLLSTGVSTRIPTRVPGSRLRPAWLLDLHRHLGGLAVIFTAIHLVGIVADSYVTFGWADVLVPMASEWKPGAVAFGIVAMYLLVAIEATSLAIRRLPRSVWRWVHRSSFVLYATATWHGVTAGTDADNRWFRIAAWASLVLVIALTLRVVVTMRRSGARRMPIVPVDAHVSVDAAPLPAPSPEPSPAPPSVHAPLPAPSWTQRRGSSPLGTSPIAAIPPLPGSVSDLGMPTSMPPPARPSVALPVPESPSALSPESDLVGVSPGGTDGGDLAPPTAGS